MKPASRTLIVALALASAGWTASFVFADDGVPVDGLPNYRERAVLVLTNAVRMAPAQYRDTYLPAGNEGILTGPAVNPVHFNFALATAARNHAVDMATNNYFSHVGLNGSTYTSRVAAAGYTGFARSENIAAGYTTPRSVMQDWLLSPGHRGNIMDASANDLGVGYAFNMAATYDHYWVQDFGIRSFTVTSPIVAGSHIIPTSGQIRFLVNVDDPAGTQPPQSVSLVLNGVSQPMALHLGTSDRGTYALTMPTAGGCRSYHFVVVAAGGQTWRYPATGEFRTFSEGGCAEDYVPGAPTDPADLNGDGVVDVNDMLILIGAWGSCDPLPADCPADINGDGGVDVNDLLLLIGAWW